MHGGFLVDRKERTTNTRLQGSDSLKGDVKNSPSAKADTLLKELLVARILSSVEYATARFKHGLIIT